jgi:3-phosphoshikimate 1-carboxyvinyltransferase
MRLLAGLLAGQLFAATLIGNEQLSRRPMGRVAEPLRLMGAQVALAAGERPPLSVTGSALRGIDYRLPVASAQVKSAVLLAGLYAEGETVVREPAPTRDHTEQLLAALGAPIERAPDGTRLRAPSRLRPLAEFVVPGDLSSAAFLVVAATIVADSDILLAAVGRNPTRTGLLDALAAMGGRCTWSSETADGPEPSGDLSVQAAPLRATTIAGALVPRLIDELPVLAVAATQATGVTEVRDAAELRVKESDRIGALAAELAKLGARIDPRPDGFAVHGPVQLRAATVDSHGDHRLAMALAIAALVADGETVVTGAECIADSFPGFAQALVALGATVETVD